jgi:predicted ATP-grasp superfamily ATP-dependent carboligase
MIENKVTNDKATYATYILIIGKSARMLVQAARAAGLKPLVIDLWGDQDMRGYAEESLLVPTLAKEHLMPAIAYFLNCYPVANGVYCSGFEQHPDSLIELNNRLLLFGNSPEVFAKLQDKPTLFALLESLFIPYPEVSFCPPGRKAAWLIKPAHNQGGVGIKRYRDNETIAPSDYWQKYQEGQPHSVLFLADGKRSQVVGFNRQWTVALNARDEFMFSGIINSTDLSDKQKSRISAWLDQLIPALSLKGLGSLDFIQSGDDSYVLEINPRPPASMQLYDCDLFVKHIAACQGKLLDYQPNQPGFTGYQIVYAQNEIQIPHGFEWPDDAVDTPTAGSKISAGQPICSMIMRGIEPQAVLDQLKDMQAYITHQLNRL